MQTMQHISTPALNTPTTGYESRRIIGRKKFHVLHQEVEIGATVEAVWAEVAGNFVKSGEIAASIYESRCLSGELTQGLGAERFLDFDFQGTRVKAKERIVDYRDCGDMREFTYDVYESKGSPLTVKVYITWVVRKAMNGKTYLGTAFIFRANISFLTGIIGQQLAKSESLRTGLLTYKHFIETGEKRVSDEKLNEIYPI
jgi:hypothetical protein